MRRALVTVSALLAVACTEAPVATRTVPEPVVAAPAPPPAAPAPAPPPAAPAPAPAPATPPPPEAPPTLQAGPDRYQLPTPLAAPCDEGLTFCGVYVIDLAGKQVTTLLRRGGDGWVVYAGKTETPVVVEGVTLPTPAGRVQRVPQTYHSPPGTQLEFSPPIEILDRRLEFPDLKGLQYALVVLGDRIYGAAGVSEGGLIEIDPKAGTYKMIALRGKQVLEVHPGGETLVLSLSDRRRASIATFDPASGKLVTEISLPRDLEPECRRSKNFMSEQRLITVPHQDRAYLEFDCHPEG